MTPEPTPPRDFNGLRILLLIFDGLGDRPVPELDGNTPLEAACTPNLDRFARESINGQVHARRPGYPLGSPLALHLMFGYPEDQFPDRGALLASARGVPIRPGEVTMAARFASADVIGGRLMLRERFIRDREAACRAFAEALVDEEIDGLHFRYVYSGRGDGLLFVSGASHEVTDTDPLAIGLPALRAHARADAREPAAAARTAVALNTYLRHAHHRLREHPANAEAPAPINALITKWAGPIPAYEPFVERWGMRPASLPDEEVVSGLMLELGFHVQQVAGDDPESDLRVRLAHARDRLDEGYEFVHVHTKYPDPLSHQQDPLAALESIEALDRAMGWYWDELASDPHLLTVLTSDHTTPSVWAGWPRGVFNDQHGGEPTPLAMRGGHVRVDSVDQFGERASAAGGLGLVLGEDFMPVLLTAAERTNMWEMRPTPIHRLHRPRPGDLDALDVS